MTVAEWIALGTIIIGAAGSIAAAIVAARKPRDDDAEKPYRPRPIALAIAEEDRSLLAELRDAITGHGRMVERHAERLDDHRRAVGDNTAAERRRE